MTHRLSKIFMAITAFNLLVAPTILRCMIPVNFSTHTKSRYQSRYQGFAKHLSLSPEIEMIHSLGEQTSEYNTVNFADSIDMSNETNENEDEKSLQDDDSSNPHEEDNKWFSLLANFGQGVSQMGAKASSSLYAATDVTGVKSLGTSIEKSTDKLADTLEKTSALLAKQVDTTTERLLDITKEIATSFDKTSITMATFAARAGKDLRTLTRILSRSQVGIQTRTLQTIDSATKKLVIATRNIENTAKIGQQTASDIAENTKDIIALSASGYIVYKTCNLLTTSIANSHTVFSEQNAAYLGCGALGVAGIMGLRHCYRAKKAA